MAKLMERYKARVAGGELKYDALQEAAAKRLQTLAHALNHYRHGKRRFFFAPPPPKGLYIWGDVGRGKSMLMDLFFETVTLGAKRRIHFNAFMTDVHAHIHAERQNGSAKDPIPPVARAIAKDAALLCFDEFQVTDVADAMILGRLFEHLFELGVVVVATSNTAPRRLYEGGLNRQLFLPFIAQIEARLDAVELNGTKDYRMQRMAGLDLYITPLGPETDAKMEAAWARLTEGAPGEAATLKVLGRDVAVPRAAGGVARFSFEELCAQPLAAANFLTIARTYHTVLIDHIPVLGPEKRNEARRFVLLIDTLYDEAATLVCTAAAPADKLYASGDGAEAFRRAVSRLTEMQSADYLNRRGATVEAAQ